MTKVIDVKFLELNEEKIFNPSGDCGVRFTDDNLKMGEDVPCSYDWTKTEEMPEEDWEEARFDGACAVGFCQPYSFDPDRMEELRKEIIEKLNMSDGPYPWDNVYIIKGYNSDYGNDAGEYIIYGAEVVGIIEIIMG